MIALLEDNIVSPDDFIQTGDGQLLILTEP
jgi:hypothetical protein